MSAGGSLLGNAADNGIQHGRGAEQLHGRVRNAVHGGSHTADGDGPDIVAGNTRAHLVRLVSASDGTAVPGGSVSITLPSGTAGQFVYVSLASPVTLNANTSYCLVSDEVSGGDQFYDLGSVTATRAASVDTAIVAWAGGLTL
jgi:hypothetical protein